MKVNLKSLGRALHFSANNPTSSKPSSSAEINPAFSRINQRANNQTSIAPRNNLPLPTELRQEVFRNLGGNDLVNALSVSKGIYSDIKSDPVSSQNLQKHLEDVSNFKFYGTRNASTLERLKEFDRENSISNTEKSQKIIKKFREKSSSDLIMTLKPFLDPDMQAIGVMRLVGSTLIGRRNKLELEATFAFREYIARELNVGVLTGQDCTVM